MIFKPSGVFPTFFFVFNLGSVDWCVIYNFIKICLIKESSPKFNFNKPLGKMIFMILYSSKLCENINYTCISPFYSQFSAVPTVFKKYFCIGDRWMNK